MNDGLLKAERLVQEYQSRIHELEVGQIRQRTLMRSVKRNYVALLQEKIAETHKRPKDHLHGTEAGGNPVLVFDFDGTLQPNPRGAYPLTTVEPAPGLKQALDGFVARGACLHVATVGLFLQDPQEYAARYIQLDSWMKRHGLPIDLLLPKVPADCYYDDRMVTVTPGSDWRTIAEDAQSRLSKRFDLVEGKWLRKDRKETGSEVSEFPDPSTSPQERPRGFSGPVLDADLHRCVLQASSSDRMSKAMPGAKEVLTDLYNKKVIINLSCAGWNPATHTKEVYEQKLANLRTNLAEEGIPYDSLVSKDHGDLFFDDKGITFKDWKKDKSALVVGLQKHWGQQLEVASTPLVPSN